MYLFLTKYPHRDNATDTSECNLVDATQSMHVDFETI